MVLLVDMVSVASDSPGFTRRIRDLHMNDDTFGCTAARVFGLYCMQYE